MGLSEIRESLNSFLIESEDLYWQNWIGVKDDIDIDALYRRYRHAFDRSAIETVRTHLKNETDPEHIHRLRALLGQQMLSYLEMETADINRKILNKESKTTVKWGDGEIPVRTLGVKIMNEQDREKRREMVHLRDEAVRKEIDPLRAEMVNGLFNAVHQLGYANYVELCSMTQNRDFVGFADEIKTFLNDSEEIYLRSLAYYLESETGYPLDDETTMADLSAVMRCRSFDTFFPQENLLKIVEKSIEGLGFDFSGIRLDLEDRPKKKPRACVSAVNPPSDVRLTVYPIGGYEDYAGLLHEMGHAVHFVRERPDLDFEFKFWGDRGFTEGTAYLFQNMTLNPEWLREMAGMSDQSAFLSFNAFLSLLRFRRLAGSFLYQMDLFLSNSLENMEELYLHHHEQAHGVRFSPSGYLSFDMELYTAGYLRARLFELPLRHYCLREFGNDWWRNGKAGDFLVQLYREGRKLRADDVVKTLGYTHLDPSMYLEVNSEILRQENP